MRTCFKGSGLMASCTAQVLEAIISQMVGRSKARVGNKLKNGLYPPIEDTRVEEGQAITFIFFEIMDQSL